jgi:hypothetical protein
MVRSKSELVVANMLHSMNITYQYERPLEGKTDSRKLRPDFSFDDPSGDLILWEHLGMMQRDDYRAAWEWKRQWYEQNGYTLGRNLFITQDDDRGGLDSAEVRRVAEQVQRVL